MQGWQRATVRGRVIAASFTLAVHGLFVLLLLLEKRLPPRELPPRRLVGMWIHLPPVLDPVDQSAAATPPPARKPEVAPPPAPAPADTPAEPTDVQPAQLADEPSLPRVDWHAEAARLAARGAGEPEAPPTIGKPLQKMREPCEPRESSFEWNAEEPKAGLLPLPYVIIAERCMISVGFFSCILGPLPPPDKHLFDDMQAGRTPDSSVPDPNTCD
jgi:hypothetical protein